MHEDHYVKARTDSLDEALTLFGDQVRRLGGVDNWWTLVGAWEVASAEPHVPALEALDWASPETAAELREQHAERALWLKSEFLSEEAWIRAAWEAGASQWQVGGLPWMTLDDSSDDAVDAFRAMRAMAVEEIPKWFLREARALVVKRYSALELDGPHRGGTADEPAILAASQRIGTARIVEVMLDPINADSYAKELPFLPDMGPYEWPAHLVGDGGRTFYLLIDMHR